MTIIKLNSCSCKPKKLEKGKNMNGEITKYYKYETSGSGTVTIPLALAKSLNWGHKDPINIVIKEIEGQVGLFLFKKKKE